MKATIPPAVSSVLILGLLFTGCGGGGSDARDWPRFKSPRGFEVSHPEGWTVDLDRDGRIEIHSPDRSELAVIQPFLLNEPKTALEWLGGAPRFLASTFPNARIQELRPLSAQTDDAAASMTYGTNAHSCRANLLVSIDGPSGMFYAIAAPAERFETDREELVRILNSFVFTQASGEAGPGTQRDVKPARKQRYVTWTDPNEHAFSVEVPQGWQVKGGMFRYASVDTRPAFELISPDQKIRITYGDAQLPPFVVPNPMMESTGFSEGSMYSPGYGVRMQVMRYMSGRDFARQYVASGLSGQHPDLRFVGERDRPELVQAVNGLYANAGMGIQFTLDAGEVSFAFSQGGQDMRGYCLATTQLVQTGYVANWIVKDLLGCLSTRDREPEARAVLRHIMATLRVDPQWFAMQQGVAGATSQIVNNTNQEISKIITDTYEHRQRVDDDLARRRSNAILGTTDLLDQETGETWRVDAGHNYYWRREHTNAIAGTGTHERPDIDFAPLVEW
ncbi:MAG: hypothetical protein KAY24_08360 [Candidatus Eisenbacteria sp.]|nr:hypothetical protein [Candidatus Eisenbacteria bacterium]